MNLKGRPMHLILKDGVMKSYRCAYRHHKKCKNLSKACICKCHKIMKVEAVIAKIIAWEDRKHFPVIERIEAGNGIYDFLVLAIPKEKTNIPLIKKLSSFVKEEIITVEQTVIYNGLWMPVKRTHNYKPGDQIVLSYQVS